MSERLPGIRPRPGVWRRLDMSARRGFPSAIAALLMLLAGAPFGFGGQAQLQVAIALACVFFWSLFRPASMPPWIVFLLGVLSDLLGFAPLGVGVLLLLTVHGFALRWRRTLVRLGFLPVWVAFTVLAVGSALARLSPPYNVLSGEGLEATPPPRRASPAIAPGARARPPASMACSAIEYPRRGRVRALPANGRR